MAVITPIAFNPISAYNNGQAGAPVMMVRTAQVQANTGQTDWVTIPAWAKFAKVVFTLSAAAGTTPVTDLSLLEMDPFVMDDTFVAFPGGTTITAQSTTATSGLMQVVDLGPGVTGIADDLVLGATGVNRAAINCPLPAILGMKLVFDRTTGNETYTYTLTLALRAS